MGCKVLLVLAIACITAEIVSAATNKVVCYHGTWSTYRWSTGKFTVEDIGPASNLCTHIIYSFVGIESSGVVRLLDSYLDVDTGNFKRFNALKTQNPKLKTLLAIGGWNEGSAKFSAVAADAAKRAVFIQSAVSLVKAYGFDGFDLDWEYPAQRDGGANDKSNFAILIKEFRQEFDKHGLLLTAAVAAAANSVDQSYDVPALSQYLDIINVMAYDLHGSWDEVTGQNAPLYASPADVSDNQKQLNVNAAIKGWIQRGADPQKLALGLGIYGRTYTLANANNNGVGAVIYNGGTAGKYTQEAGFLGYNEILELQAAGGWTVVWDDVQKVPYAYKGNQWVGYDNPKSIAIKVEYAKSLNLGGVMIWSIETEDFTGISGTKFPLLKAINQALDGTFDENIDIGSPPNSSAPVIPSNPSQSSSSEKPSSSSSSSSTTTSTAAPPSSTTGVCSVAGYARDPIDCSVFYYCLPNSDGTFQALRTNCGSGLVFDVKNSVCNYPSAVDC